MTENWQLILFAAFFAAFLGAVVTFAAWLARRTVEHGGILIGMQKDIKSLLSTREKQEAAEIAGTGKRLDNLEQKL